MRGGTANGWFLNAVGLFDSDLSPQALLETCIDIEDRARRRRAQRWGDRTLDLDLLVIENQHIDEPSLQIPHPGIAHRDFVLRPLLEVWPDVIHPATGSKISLSALKPIHHAVPIGILAPNKAPVTSSLYRGIHPAPTLQRYQAPDGLL
jgi:7,8-dihydro-6-hydroxymethylpterin-pyrophosphokinase